MIKTIVSPVRNFILRRKTGNGRSNILQTYGTRLTFLTLILEIVQIVTMYFIPQKYISFNQRDCDDKYDPTDTFGTLWFAFFFSQLVTFLVVTAIYFILFKALGSPSTPKKGENSDIIGWFEESIRGMVSGAAPDDRSVLVPSCLALLQIQTWFIWLPVPEALAACQCAICIFSMLWTSFIRPFRVSHFFIFLGLAILSFPAIALPIAGHIQILRNSGLSEAQSTIISLSPFAPFASDVLILVLSTSCLWKSRNKSKSIKMLIYCVMFVLPLLGLKVIQTGVWYLYNIHFRSRGPPEQLRTIVDIYEPLFFGLFTFTSLPWMFVSWLSVTRWSKGARQNGENLHTQPGYALNAARGDLVVPVSSENDQTAQNVFIKSKDSLFKYILTGRAYLLKFGLLVAFPTALWISAIRFTDFTSPGTEWTFGQTFAVLVSAGCVVEVLVDLHETKGPGCFIIFEQILKSKEINWNVETATEQSTHRQSQAYSVRTETDKEKLGENTGGQTSTMVPEASESDNIAQVTELGGKDGQV